MMELINNPETDLQEGVMYKQITHEYILDLYNTIKDKELSEEELKNQLAVVDVLTEHIGEFMILKCDNKYETMNNNMKLNIMPGSSERALHVGFSLNSDKPTEHGVLYFTPEEFDTFKEMLLQNNIVVVIDERVDQYDEWSKVTV